MTQKKDAVGNNPLSHLIPRGPAPRPQVTTPPVQAQPAPTPNSTPISTPVAAPAAASAPPAAPPAASILAQVPAPVPGMTVPTPSLSTPPPVAALAPRATPAVAPHAAAAALAVVPPEAVAHGEVQPLKRCTVRLPVALLERMTSAIVHTPGMTQADFVHDAIAAHLDELERSRGAAFPVYGKKLRPGRKSW